MSEGTRMEQHGPPPRPASRDAGPRVSGAGARAIPHPAPEPYGDAPARVGETGPGVPGDGHVRGEHGHSEPPAPPVAPRQGGRARRLPRRHSVRGQVLDALRHALLAGELAPGRVYSAPALAERFGVSATPVREAMHQLAAEGAVDVVPNRGFRVARRSARDLAELAQIRALLEVPVMLELARTVPAERWEELRPLAAETAAAAARRDRVAYAEADRAFHHALLALTGNRQLASLGADLHRRAQGPAADGAAVRPSDLVADAAEHTELLDALAARDTAAVERLASDHARGARLAR